LVNKQHLSDNQTYVIVGSFTALAYINSIFGGLIADYFTNYTNAIIMGGALLFLGYFILGIAGDMSILNIGLACITVGTGSLKPNVSSMLSILYPNHDTRKDTGLLLWPIY